jgi:hypothetical protein
MSDYPLVDWPALDAGLAAGVEACDGLSNALGAVSLSESAALAPGVGLTGPAAAVGILLIADLSRNVAMLIRAVRTAMPAYARSIGQDPDAVIAYCPRCLAAVVDSDGLGVPCHKPCGYCTHPSMDGTTCQVCGAEAGTNEFIRARCPYPLLPDVSGRVVMAKDKTTE